jgi:Protein of unknown function (DUF2637)
LRAETSQAGPQSITARETTMRRQARTTAVWASIVLVPVALIGAVLSFESLYQAATPTFGPRLALGFPLLADLLILGASLHFVSGAKIGLPRAGWRMTAHAGVAATLSLNALAARSLHDVPWHITAPAVWSVLVELTARDVLGEWRATHTPQHGRIPLRLWLTAPIESARTWLRIARRVHGEQAEARLDVGLHAAAVAALRLAIPGRRGRRVRRILERQLRAGSLPPAAILSPLGWGDAATVLEEITPEAVLRAALHDALLYQRQAHQAPSGPADAITTQDVVSITGIRHPSPPDEPQPATDPGTRTIVIDLRSNGKQSPTPSRPRDSARSEDQPVDIAAVASSGDRFMDAVDLLRANNDLTASQMIVQLGSLGWTISDRTAAQIMKRAHRHLADTEPRAVSTL